MTRIPALVFIAATLACASLQAQTPVRVRGTITSIDGAVMSVRAREGQDLKIELAPNASVAYAKALRLEDVQPGTALGTGAVKGPDGRLIARELHLFPGAAKAPNEGHRPHDLEPGSTMTNGSVTATTQATGGRELTLNYDGGSQQVVVPAGIPVVTAVSADRSYLRAGEYVVVTATLGADGRVVASRIQVSRDGVRPPM